MKKKTIEKVINKKFDEWLKSITDKDVRDLVEKHSLITGGCIASMLLNEPVNDFDVYLTNKRTTKAVAEYYVKQFNGANNEQGYVLDGALMSAEDKERVGGAAFNMDDDRIKVIFDSIGVAKEEGSTSPFDDFTDEEIQEQSIGSTGDTRPTYRPVYMSTNAITLSDKIQIVLRFYGEPDEIHQHYDYIHCTNYWLSKERKVTLKQPALEALLAKELVYIGSKYPIASMIRTRKFIKRGWSITAGQYLKMAFQVSEFDLTDVNVLEDQLTGVDVAYFNILVEALREAKPDKIDATYIGTIVDKIFN